LPAFRDAGWGRRTGRISPRHSRRSLRGGCIVPSGALPKGMRGPRDGADRRIGRSAKWRMSIGEDAAASAGVSVMFSLSLRTWTNAGFLRRDFRHLLFAVLAATLPLTTLLGQDGSPDRSLDKRMQLALPYYLRTLFEDQTARYAAAFQDLDGDGRPEAVVYLAGRDWCGTGGCRTVILSCAGGTWRVMTRVSITRPPIRLLKSKSNGWYDLGVWVQGGGIQPGYEAQLRFDGGTYPENPSTPPAKQFDAKLPGTVMISTSQTLTPLYPKP
jgi:hypothetical protein